MEVVAARGSLRAWVPRGLLQLERWDGQQATGDGLVAVELAWTDGRLLAPRVLSDAEPRPHSLALPRFADPHVHLDKAFTWSEAPNFTGTYDGALAANLQEHRFRTKEGVLERGDRALRLACSHGLRALRSHIDSVGPGAAASWSALLELRSRWSHAIELQLVALAPLDYWSSAEGLALAQEVGANGGLLGGVLVPPFRAVDVRRQVHALLDLAEKVGCGIDLHIDEAGIQPAAGLNQLLAVLDQRPCSIPITCSHCSSLGLASRDQQRCIAERLAQHQVAVVALPLTNGWLLGRQGDQTPVLKPLAPIRTLQRAGVTVAVGADNVVDPWFPVGDLDPLSLMASALPLTQLAPWERLGLAPFTTAAAAAMNLSWTGLLHNGAPADLLVLEATSWSEALCRPKRRVLVAGRWWSARSR